MPAAFTPTVTGRDVRCDAAASALPAPIVDYAWDFGDGVTSSGATVSHTYLGQATAFTIALTVTDAAGNTATVTHDVVAGGAIYIATDGTAGGDGSIGDPYDMGSVFDGANTGVVGAGDTIWLRGGTYVAADIVGAGTPLQLWVAGAEGNPCVVRPVPGEHVLIEGPFLQRGADSEVRGAIEFRHSDPDTATALAGYALHAVRGRAIDVVVHDAPLSGFFCKEATAGDELVDGSVLYNNGTHPNFDHGLYAWNPASAGIARRFRALCAFQNWGFGLHAYSETEGQLHDLVFEDCVAFLNGLIGGGEGDTEHADLIVSGSGASDIVVRRLRTWHRAAAAYPYTLWLGDTGATPGNSGLAFEDCYLVGTVAVASDWTDETESGNTVIDPDAPPSSGLVAFLRPSPEAPDTALLVVYNWAGLPRVLVDASAFLRAGDGWALHHVYDLFGDAVASGTWPGGTMLSVPMAAAELPSPPAPLGRAFTAPENPAPRFAVFRLTRTAQSHAAPAPALARLGDGPDVSTARVAGQTSGLVAGEAIGRLDACVVGDDGRVWRASALAASGRAGFDGLAPRATRAGEALTLLGINARFGYHAAGGLTPGAPLYLTAAYGGLSHSPAAVGQRPVAKAATATDLLVTALA